LLASWRSLMKIAGSGFATGSGSISQRNGPADPDPHQNVINPEHCLLQNKKSSLHWTTNWVKYIQAAVLPLPATSRHSGRKYSEFEIEMTLLPCWKDEKDSPTHTTSWL
jgi:hypothetical protein